MSSIPGGDSSNGIDFTNSPSLTKQAFAKECDVNNIVAGYMKQGVYDQVMNSVSQNLEPVKDYTSVLDYQDAMNLVASVEKTFTSLPSDLRDRFANQPGRLLDFIQNDKNYDEAVKLGLIQPKVKEPEVIQKVQIVDPTGSVVAPATNTTGSGTVAPK